MKLTLIDQFKQGWDSEVFNSPKCINYRIFKTEFNFENYLNSLAPRFRNLFCKYRSGNFKLPIETGRWRNVPRSDRKCTLCNKNEVGDEFHYLFTCTFDPILQARHRFLPTFCQQNPNILKFHSLFNNSDAYILKKYVNFYQLFRRG